MATPLPILARAAANDGKGRVRGSHRQCCSIVSIDVMEKRTSPLEAGLVRAQTARLCGDHMTVTNASVRARALEEGTKRWQDPLQVGRERAKLTVANNGEGLVAQW